MAIMAFGELKETANESRMSDSLWVCTKAQNQSVKWPILVLSHEEKMVLKSTTTMAYLKIDVSISTMCVTKK